MILLVSPGHLRTQFKDFVARSGDKLIDGDHELRFISFNTPNLHYLEDCLPFGGANPFNPSTTINFDVGKAFEAKLVVYSFLMMSDLFPKDEHRYYERFCIQWDYCKKYVIDNEHGGWC